MFASVVEQEFSIVLVIALLAAGGSQLPKLLRALGRSSHGDDSAGRRGINTTSSRSK